MEKTQILSAQDARDMMTKRLLSLDEVMQSISRDAKMGLWRTTYDARTIEIPDDVLIKIKELGYTVQFSNYSEYSKFIDISWREQADAKPASVSVV